MRLASEGPRKATMATARRIPGRDEEGVGEVDVDDGVGEAAVEAGEHAEDGAEGERDADDGDGDEERDAGSVEGAGEDVAA